MPFPIVDLNEEFRFGVGVSVSKKSWSIYRNGYDNGDYETDSCFVYLSNPIPEFEDSMLLHAGVFFSDDGMKPLIYLNDCDHPLVAAQERGRELEYIKCLAGRFH